MHLFLDIDGVLNGHEYDEASESCHIRPECVNALNLVLDLLAPQIVLSSAWRYMVLNEAMSLKGFEYLLRSHRVHCKGLLVDTTWFDGDYDLDDLDDEKAGCAERARLITSWTAYKRWHPAHYVAVDDLPLPLPETSFVQTDAKSGLTVDKAEELIRKLRHGVCP